MTSAELVILMDLALVIFTAKVLEEVVVHFNQPPILGDLLAGIIIGPTVLGLIQIHTNVEVIGWLGIVILIFLAGLETDIEAARKYGISAFLVALGGVLFTFLLAYIIAVYFNYPWLTALFIATILSPTSVSVTSTTLMELGVLKTNIGEIIMGAAFIDDVMAMVLFALVSSIVYHGEVRIETILLIAAGLLVIISIFLLLYKVSDKIFGRLMMSSRLLDAPMAHLIIVGLGMAILSSWFGLSPLVGAYLAGLAMSRVVRSERVLGFFQTLVQIIAPFFFVYAGLLLDPWLALSRIQGTGIVEIVLAVVAAGIVGKVLGCGLAARLRGLDYKSSLIVGVGMMPRAGVDLVIAVVGLTTGVLTQELYLSALILIYVTSLTTPVLLNRLILRRT